MKKTLILSPHNPFLRSSGGENRIYLLMKEKAKAGPVILVCPEGKTEPADNIRVYQLFKDISFLKTLNLGLALKLKQVIKKEKPDEVQVEFPWQAVNLWIIGQGYNLVEHNVEFLRFKRLKSILWPLLYVYEKYACLRARKITCVSEKDKNYLAEYFAVYEKKMEVVENPVDAAKFHPSPAAEKNIRGKLKAGTGEKIILFFGQLNYAPNVEAVQVIIKELLPRLKKTGKKFKVVICGKGDARGLLHNYADEGLVFEGFVENIQDYINASDVVIVPLKSGSGTRIKILESLACGKKVVSTSIGAEGIPGSGLMVIEDNWDRFVKEVIA